MYSKEQIDFVSTWWTNALLTNRGAEHNLQLATQEWEGYKAKRTGNPINDQNVPAYHLEELCLRTQVRLFEALSKGKPLTKEECEKFRTSLSANLTEEITRGGPKLKFGITLSTCDYQPSDQLAVACLKVSKTCFHYLPSSTIMILKPNGSVFVNNVELREIDSLWVSASVSADKDDAKSNAKIALKV